MTRVWRFKSFLWSDTHRIDQKVVPNYLESPTSSNRFFLLQSHRVCLFMLPAGEFGLQEQLEICKETWIMAQTKDGFQNNEKYLS